MTPSTPQTTVSPWARLSAELPSDAGRQALLVGPAAGRDEVKLPADAKAATWDPAEAEKPPTGPFDLILCARAIEATAHPANLLTALCDVTVTGAALLLHSPILTDPEQSTYARFVGAGAGAAEDAEWVPGRLALRWTVETNGFGVDRWLDAGPSEPRGLGDAFILATRNERTPALILATPIPVDGPGPGGGRP